MNCSNCGLDNLSEARYCARCGMPLPTSGQPGPDAGSQPPLGTGSTTGLAARTIRQLLADTFAVYVQGFPVLLRIALVAQAPLYVAVFIPNEALAISFALGVGLLTNLLASAATTRVVARMYLGQPVTATGSYVAALNSGTTLLVNGTVYFILVLLAAILILVVVGIILLPFMAVIWLFHVQATMIEGKGALVAMARSAQLVRGSWWRVFAILLVISAIILAAALLVSLPGQALSLANKTAGGLVSATLGALVTPLGFIWATLVYLDLRVRKEDYTLDQLAKEVAERP